MTQMFIVSKPKMLNWLGKTNAVQIQFLMDNLELITLMQLQQKEGFTSSSIKEGLLIQKKVFSMEIL